MRLAAQIDVHKIRMLDGLGDTVSVYLSIDLGKLTLWISRWRSADVSDKRTAYTVIYQGGRMLWYGGWR